MDTATTERSSLPLHGALPSYPLPSGRPPERAGQPLGVEVLTRLLPRRPDPEQPPLPVALQVDAPGEPVVLIDQGKADSFLEKGLRPWLFEEAIKDTDIGLTLRLHDRYDHSYYFISTFMDDHLRWHAERLG